MAMRTSINLDLTKGFHFFEVEIIATIIDLDYNISAGPNLA